MSAESKEKSVTVQLGCGTLILIALIVAFCSGAGQIDDIEVKVDALRAEVAALREAVERQTAEEVGGEEVEGERIGGSANEAGPEGSAPGPAGSPEPPS